MQNKILNLLNCKAFQELKSFYEETTIFNVIGAERSETRHSAFLRWLFSPDSSHGLGTEPLKLFLRLVATQQWGQQIFKDSLYAKVMAGNYELELLEPIELEKNVGKLSDGKGQDKDRIDVWMVVGLTYEDQDETQKKVFPIVIENKIYAKEGGPKKGSNLSQTERYQQAMLDYCAAQQKPEEDIYHPIGVMLSPTQNAKCPQFTNLNYQQLLDYVLEPVAAMAMPPADKAFVEAYIRNLGKPSAASTHGYSVLAISKQERELVDRLYEVDEQLFQQALVATFENQAKSILDNEFKKVGKSIGGGDTLLRELWDGNEEIFKAVIYQEFSKKTDLLEKLFKTSNRDNSKYRVYHQDEIFQDEIFPGKRLSKAMAACAIFQAYLREHPETKLEDLRTAFPCADINYYYKENFYAELFYYTPEVVDEEGDFSLTFTAGRHKDEPSKAKWDFYLQNHQLLHLENGAKTAMCVKMWRKGDFDRLVEHVQKNYNDFITIEDCL